MRLVYTADQQSFPEGQEVKVGDEVESTRDIGTTYKVEYFRPPHKPSSSGKVSVGVYNKGEYLYCMEYYVSVIGAEWIEREDQV